MNVIHDRVFLKLAHKVGYPEADEVARLRVLQVERLRKGENLSLFTLAKQEKALTPKQQRSYDRWAKQIEAKEADALVEDEESASGAVSDASSAARKPEATRSGRVVAQSAADFAAISGEDASEDLDELIKRFAQTKKEAKEKEAKAPPAESEELIKRFAKDEASESGSEEELPRKTASTPKVKTASLGKIKTPTAGRIRTPSTASAGRVRTTKGFGRGAPQGSGAIVAVGVGVVALVGIGIVASSHGPESGPPASSEKQPPRVAAATSPVTNTNVPSGSGPLVPDAKPVPRPFGSDASDPGDSLDPKAQAAALLETARALIETGDTAAARGYLDEVKSLDPSCPGLAEVERALAKAESDYAKANPDHPVAPREPSPEPSVNPAEPAPPGGEPAPGSPDDPKKPNTPAAPKPGQPVIERWPDGKIKLKHGTDSKGRISGEFAEFYETGKPKVRARYSEGVLHGPYAEFWPNGKPKKKAEYRKANLNGRLIEWEQNGKLATDAVWNNGLCIYPRSVQQICSMLAEIDASPVAEPKPAVNHKVEFAPMDAQQQARPIRRLRQHRWLVGVPWDVDLGFEYGEQTTAAARLLDLVGHLDHTPKKPGGCSDSLYEAGYQGTSRGNLFMGLSDLIQCIDGWMDDSDPSNIDRVGHRRWCINPPMKRTAIGQYGQKWTVLYAHDSARTDFEEPAIVRYPAAGFFPTTHIHADAAWSISLSGSKYRDLVLSEVSVTVRPCDEKLRKAPPVELNYFTVNNDGYGQPRCIIFRPKAPYRPGEGYWVEAKGIKDAEGKPVTIEYYVEFFNPGR